MQTILTILSLILIYGIVSRLIGVFVLNIVGVPGALVGYNTIRKNELRYVLGVIISAISHIYFYSVYMIYVINWTRYRIDNESFTKYLIWFFCMVATVGAIQQIHHKAQKEAKESPNGYQNPQILSLLITEIVSFFSFFLFVFYPRIVDPLWTWVMKIGFPF